MVDKGFMVISKPTFRKEIGKAVHYYNLDERIELFFLLRLRLKEVFCKSRQ